MPASLNRSPCLCVSFGMNFFTIYPSDSILFICTMKKSPRTRSVVGDSHNRDSWYIRMEFLPSFFMPFLISLSCWDFCGLHAHRIRKPSEDCNGDSMSFHTSPFSLFLPCTVVSHGSG